MTARRAQRGISLLEALVAILVMAFGTLALLGVQSTLRLNGDIAKQRAEATRIAQEAIEDWRAFGTLAEYDAVDSADAEEIDGYTTNTTYTVTRRVDTASTDVAGAVPPRSKALAVDVDWTDRAGQAQRVTLSSALHGLEPALAGSLAVPANATYLRQPGGRHGTVPREAQNEGDGTSTFIPPGAGAGVRWTFDNVSGEITRLCDSCDPVNARLLAGYVRFALTAAQPLPSDAELPPSTAVPVAVTVLQTAPTGQPAPTCYMRQSTSFVAYYCAIQLGTEEAWSGRSELVANEVLVWSTGTAAADERVCRYTRLVDGAPSTEDADHPANYTDVTVGLVNQNFLVIRAGDGSVAFTCPGDDTTTPYINGQTWLHQPDGGGS